VLRDAQLLHNNLDFADARTIYHLQLASPMMKGRADGNIDGMRSGAGGAAVLLPEEERWQQQLNGVNFGQEQGGGMGAQHKVGSTISCSRHTDSRPPHHGFPTSSPPHLHCHPSARSLVLFSCPRPPTHRSSRPAHSLVAPRD
jgi:hypothetical protein